MKLALSIVALLAGLAVLVVAGRESVDILRGRPDARSSEEAAIRAADAEWLKATRAKDPDRTAAFYAEDASVFPVAEPIITGREAIRAEWSHMFAIPDFENTSQMTRLEVSRSGDLAYAQGTYVARFQDADGRPATEPGKWIVIWKKQPDGAWRIAAEIYNTDAPPPSHK